MSEERTRILEILAQGTITVEETEKLLEAVGTAPPHPALGRKLPKYLRVEITGKDHVNVRVPVQLLRTGIKLGALLPDSAKGKVDTALESKGVDLDLSRLKSEDVDEFLRQLADLSIDIDDGEDKVRVFCE